MVKDYPIDIVVTWLDSSDPDWQKEYGKYRDVKPQHDSRYRNWDNFHYWFRAIEKNAPWVNKIFLVTCGHYPKWLNTNHEKLVLVKHSDYIPQQYLPTFNSRCIELNFGRIKGLSEHFVYFNDDVFLNNPTEPSVYFKDGLPVDYNYERVFLGLKYNPKDRFGIELSLMCNIAVLNAHFNRRDVIKAAPMKWYGFHHTKASFKQSLLLKGKERFEGFTMRHSEMPFLRSVFDEIWEKEAEMLDRSCTRFRVAESLTPYFVRYWQLASNRFYPCKQNGAFKAFSIREDSLNAILHSFDDSQTLSICLNDNPCCDSDFFNRASLLIEQKFQAKYPEKCSFEL